MSTRSNIIIKDDSSKFYLYRHCDGYPEETGVNLKKILDKGIYGSCDSAFLATKIIQYSELARYSNMVSYPYELTYCIHGDIEYLYVIELSDDRPKLTCYRVRGSDPSEEDIVKPENEEEIPEE